MRDEKKLESILNLVSEYIEESENKEWVAERDWVSYSGLYYDKEEYLAALKVLLSGWLIFGENAILIQGILNGARQIKKDINLNNKGGKNNAK